MSTFSTKDAEAIHEAQQAVNLAVSPVHALAFSDDPLLTEIGLDLLARIQEIDAKLTRIAGMTDQPISGFRPKT